VRRREFFKSVAATGTAAVLGTEKWAVAQPTPKQPKHPGHPYSIGPDSKYQPGVPRGKMFQFPIRNPVAYPGMDCTIEVYVPAQYKADKPTCVGLLLDGFASFCNAPMVFDNLLHKKEMPVTIGIGLGWGTTSSSSPGINPRFDRSFEFDSMTDVLADFIIHQVLPEVQNHTTPDGLPILLSNDPNDRLIGGGSTGGIGSFNVAWRRPDAFHRICIISGTFVGMRGGDRFPTLIRKTEPKPLRVFINDGTNDEWWGGPEFGDWWLSNETVESALTFAGYDVNHIWGLGAHGEQGAAMFPDMMRWLWKDWPGEVAAGQTQNFNIAAILKSGEGWTAVSENQSASDTKATYFRGYSSPPVLDAHSTTTAIVSDRNGRVFFMNPAEGRISHIGDEGKMETFASISPGSHGLAFGPDGRLYAAETARSRVVAYDPAGRVKVIADGLTVRDLTVTHQGDIYMTEAEESRAYSGKVWLVRADGETQVVADGLNGPSGISLAPDGLWLFVAEHNGHHGWNYQVQPDGLLRYGIPFYWFHVPDSANNSGVVQTCMDREGRAYAATRMGIQVFDRNGRVTAILPVFNSQLAGICFGGSDFQTLFVTTGTKIYQRKIKTVGMLPSASPIVLPPWGAG
jgi:sugar lactone lactonase YvrE